MIKKTKYDKKTNRRSRQRSKKSVTSSLPFLRLFRKELLAIVLLLPAFLFILSKARAANVATSEAELIRQKCEAFAAEYPEQKLPNICTQEGTSHTEASPTPTPVVSTSPTPVAENQPISYCETHSTTEYHALYNEEEDCWYDHEHGDDPNSVSDIFGPVAAWWGGSQEISYPWQTYGFEGSMSGGGDNYPVKIGSYENEAKHEGYKWHVRRDLPCYSQFAGGCITALRALDHADATHGMYVRFHSFAVEMVVCNEARPDDCGILRTGGWADKGNLAIDGSIIPGYGPTERNGGTRLHYFSRGDKRFGTWYGGSKKAEVVTQFEDMWATIDPNDLHTLIFVCPDDPANCGYNSSKRQLHLVGAMITGQEVRWLRQQGFADRSGKVNFRGYTDRYGIFVKDAHCTESGIDCVPIEYINYDATVLYQYRGDSREHDTSIGVLESSPIRHPN